MTYTLQEQYTSKNSVVGAQADSVWHRGARNVSSITIHHWGLKGQRFDTVRDFLCTNNSPTSAHYVAQDGLVACIVSPDDCAFHAGNAEGNTNSIGIECRPEATDGDYQTVAELIRNIRAIYGDIPLYPHNHWFNTACPGDWDLARLDRMARSAGTITTQSTTQSTPAAPEEDELAFTISDLLNYPAYDNGPTVSQVLKNLDDSEVTRYVKGDQEPTLYDVTDSGKLRPIILAEWQATGRPYRTLPQVIINALPKTS